MPQVQEFGNFKEDCAAEDNSSVEGNAARMNVVGETSSRRLENTLSGNGESIMIKLENPSVRKCNAFRDKMNALCNEAWRMEFLEAYVKVLTRVDFSDYHLILITPENSKHNEAPKQFRFQSAWMLEECYQDTITKSWTDDYADLQRLYDQVSDEEVRTAVFSMKPWKAPGPDGFHARFYLKSLSIDGKKVCDYVKKVWLIPSEIDKKNQTDDCMILKVSQPQLVS
ncbi:hypothetical protein KIW84_011746 [Lathyrus oleraceus]|uniref:Uncharacterized protein n=1 Tax=Pisum sativum TaxID=3888 RepID=A0A9D5BFU1_PEA|nr:hypothetical protein KIW84_011746 [Pisum sativum]